VKRRLLTGLAVAAALAAVAGPAAADAGAPGTTFPEQANTGTACPTVLSNPSQGFHDSGTAAAIKAGLVADACLGG